jgi:hypothetical protein
LLKFLSKLKTRKLPLAPAKPQFDLEMRKVVEAGFSNLAAASALGCTVVNCVVDCPSAGYRHVKDLPPATSR